VFVVFNNDQYLEKMAVKGAKVERHSVSEQPHELNYEAKKTGTSAKKVEATKKLLGAIKGQSLKRN